jgi:hypothetical protein
VDAGFGGVTVFEGGAGVGVAGGVGVSGCDGVADGVGDDDVVDVDGDEPSGGTSVGDDCGAGVSVTTFDGMAVLWNELESTRATSDALCALRA